MDVCVYDCYVVLYQVPAGTRTVQTVSPGCIPGRVCACMRDTAGRPRAHACGTPPAGHVLLFLFLFRHGHALVRQLQAWLCRCHCFPWPGMGSVSHLTTSMRASTVATGSLLGLGLPACKLRCTGSAQ